MAGRGDIHGVRIPRIDDDPRDRLRFRETEMRERLAAVGRLIDTVAERRGLAIVRLARTDVHDGGVRRVDRDVADGGGAVGLEDRLERRGVVLRLEHAADGVADVDDIRIALGHRDVVDAAAHAGGTDRAESEAGKQRVVRLIDDRALRRTVRLARWSDADHGEREQREHD